MTHLRSGSVKTLCKEAAATNTRGGIQTYRRIWDANVLLAETAKDGIIEACFDEGVPNDDIISRHVAANLQHFLSSSIQSHHATVNGAARAPIDFISEAKTLALRVPSEVVAARSAYTRKQPNLYDRMILKAKNSPLVAFPIIAFTAIAVLFSLLASVKTLFGW